MFAEICANICEYAYEDHATLENYIKEQNIKFTNKSRSSYILKLDSDKLNLPLLKNNTKNVITYKNDIEEFKKKRKKRFWEKLISNNEK